MITVLLVGLLGPILVYLFIRSKADVKISLGLGALLLFSMFGFALAMFVGNRAPIERVAVGPTQALVPVAENFYAVDMEQLGDGSFYLVFHKTADGKINAKVIIATQKSPVIHELVDSHVGYMQKYREQIPSDVYYAPFVIKLDIPLYELYIPTGSILKSSR